MRISVGSTHMVAFNRAVVPQSDRGKRVKQRDYLPEGRIPVIDQGQSHIGGYTNDDDFMFKGELPVLLFGDHTRTVKLVDHRFAVGADGIKIFRPADGVRPKYLYYWMKSARIPDRGYGRHYQFLRQLSLPLPDATCQDEIVADIEQQFSRLDEAVATLKRVKANLKRYKAAVLKGAVEGRLVPTEAELARRAGRSYETGAQLLQRILGIRRSQWRGKAKYRESSAADLSAVEVLPDGWAWSSLDALLREPLRNGHSAKATDDPSGLRAFTLSAVTEGDFSEANTKRTVALAEKVADLWAQPGDIYVERSNTPELVGTACLYRGPANYAFIPDLLIRVRVCEWLLPAYVEIALQSDSGRRYFKGRAQGISGTMPKIDQSAIEVYPIPLPPFDEQHRIVTEVDRRLSLAREVEAEVDTNRQRAERLRQATLQEAFAGASSAR